MYNSAWNTYLFFSQLYLFIIQIPKKPPDGFFTYIFFWTKTIQTFSGSFIFLLFGHYQFKIKWMKAPTYAFYKEEYSTRKNQLKAEIQAGRQERINQKDTPKENIFPLQSFASQTMPQTFITDMFHKTFRFDSNGSSVVVDSLTNMNIWFNDWIFIWKI